MKDHPGKQPFPQLPGVGMTGMAYPALNTLVDRGKGDFPLRILILIFTQFPPHPQYIVLGEQPVIRKDPVAQEADALARPIYPALARVEPEPQPVQVCLHRVQDFVQSGLVIAEGDKIIHITNIGQPQFLLDEMVKVVQKNVGKELAGEIADGDALFPGQRGEEIVAGKVERKSGFLPGTDDLPDQPAGVRTADLPEYPGQENFMINALEILLDIAFQHVAEPPGISAESVGGGMDALVSSAGI